MDWKASPPAIEILATAAAAAVLGGAVAFAVAGLAPFGAGPLAASLAGGLVALAAWQIVQRIDQQRGPNKRFVPEPFADLLADEQAVLVDRNASAASEEAGQAAEDDEGALVLDDPLPAAGESRVLQLFAKSPEETAQASPAFAAPGEMVARIADFLDQGRGTAGVTPINAQRPATEDASAALHAALADIRRSLRQA